MNWIEITTRMGCKNLCTYCPQDTLLSSYKSSKRIMTFEDFKDLLPRINKHTTQIHFSGFSESFLNKDSAKMMTHAYEQDIKSFYILH